MSLIASGFMGLFGAGYCAIGASMLAPRLDGWVRLGSLYPSLFKRFLRAGGGETPENPGGKGEGEEEVLLPREDLAFRFLAYVLLLLGVCRLVSGLYWGCGYVALGLGTCLAEMGLLGYELLTHETVVLYRVMGVLCELVLLSLVYIGSALPYCR
jgi:hypothetical protein